MILCLLLGGCHHQAHLQSGSPAGTNGPTQETIQNQAYSHYLKAQYYLFNAQLEAAISEYEKAVKYDPQSA